MDIRPFGGGESDCQELIAFVVSLVVSIQIQSIIRLIKYVQVAILDYLLNLFLRRISHIFGLVFSLHHLFKVLPFFLVRR